MRLLFAITVVAFCAVLWVALAIARRVRRSQVMARGQHFDFAQSGEARHHPAFRPGDRASVPRDQASRHPVSRQTAPQEFFEAGEFRTPRPLRLEQEIFQQKPRRPLSEMSFPTKAVVPASTQTVSHPVAEAYGPIAPPQADVSRPQDDMPMPQAETSRPQAEAFRPQSEVSRSRAAEPVPIRPAQTYASIFGQTVPIASITEQLPQARQHLETSTPEILSPRFGTPVAQTSPASLPLPFTLHRRPPQSAGPFGLRRRIDLSHYSNDMGDLTDPNPSGLRGSGTQGPVPVNRRER